MKVRNILVNDKIVFLDGLIRGLIKYNISYVLIDNYEIHFENYIVRLYDLCDVLKMKKEIVYSDLNGLIHEDDKLAFFIQSEKENKPKYIKKLIKQQNKVYSNMINTKRIK